MPPSENTLLVHQRALYPLQHVICDNKFSWAAELRHLFSRRFLNILCWPLFKLRNRYFLQSDIYKYCRRLPLFSELWETVQKGSFAYNSLFLGLNPLRNKANYTLADLTTLAIVFGDEFIDGIASVAGKPTVANLLKQNRWRFYLRRRIINGNVQLYYNFDLCRIFSAWVMNAVNPKYQICYSEFQQQLSGLLQLINNKLIRLPPELANSAAEKIADTCNTCFDSYVSDIHSCQSEEHIASPQAVLNFHEEKTGYMQIKLLELRCILLDKKEAMTGVEAPGWIDIMRVLQIYDDIRDAVADYQVQDNLLLSVSAHHFPEEWKWFLDHVAGLPRDSSTMLLSLHMPASIEYCQRLAATRIRNMNWEQEKIIHCLLLKPDYSFFTIDENQSVDNHFLYEFYHVTKKRLSHLEEDAIKTFTLNNCMHLRNFRKYMLKKLNFSEYYQLRYNLFSVPPETKTAIFDKLFP